MVSKFVKITQKTKGQAMAEFALTIPVFLLLVFGIIELSRFFLVYSSVFTAVREATRYGSSVGDEGISNYLDCSEIAETAVRTGHFGGVQKGDVTISYQEENKVDEGPLLKIIASCPNTNPKTEPTRTDDGKKYVPGLGDRIFIEIATDYVSLLGVVPNLTVDASNGRTIMLGIQNQVASNPPADDEEEEEDGGDEGGEDGGDGGNEGGEDGGDGGDEGGEDGGDGGDEGGEDGGDGGDGGDEGGEDGGDGGNEGGDDGDDEGGDEVICIDPEITLQEVSYSNKDNDVIVSIKNFSNETYKLNNFYGLQWNDNKLSIDYIEWDETLYPGNSLSPVENIPIPSNKVYQINGQETQDITFRFLKNSNNLKIKFNLIFYTLDNNCPTKPINISNY